MNGIVSRIKARLVSQGYNQQDGIDYDETYALVARLVSIRILLTYACALDFKQFQIDVKSAFLNSFISKEVYVVQPSRFIDFEKSNHVYKLKKALYGLKQAPKAWPDIMFSVYLCARFQEAPKTSHLEVVKRCCLTSWFLKTQTALAISTTEVEYVSTGKACQQALWMKQALIDYDDIPLILNARVESSGDEESLGENASKQERMIDAIDQDEDITLEERLARERAKKEQEANNALIETWDDIQEKIDADHQEKKKALCSKESRREKEQTTNTSLKEKDNVAFRKVNTFEAFRPKLVERKEKRAREEMIQESTKKQKVEDDKETTELKKLMEIIPDKEEVETDAIPLAIKSIRIVDWKIHKEGKKSYYQIVRADGKSQMYMVFSKMLESFNREDLEDLYKLVKAKFKSTRLVEDLDFLL
nr:copia protein [Tanacetum cinerariifolium]